jgi:hypothetical protein
MERTDMSGSRVNSWSIDRIQCSDWSRSTGLADVWASNLANDEISFSMALHPDGFSALFNIEIDFYSPDLHPYQGQEIIEEFLLEQAESTLNSWQQQVEKIREFIIAKQGKLTKGISADDVFYAAIAQIYELRAKMQPLYVSQLLSSDMSVPMTTVKERLRKAREKEFLTSPGKGMNGQGEITSKALKLLKKEEIV